jgi:hypothetical protein
VYLKAAFVLALTTACFAQNREWELGGFAGYGWYRNARVFSDAGTADAGVRNRFVAGAVFTQDAYEHFSGEIRYVYHDGDPFISYGGTRQNVQGQSHTIVYDLLVHAFGREGRVRPYIAAGAGAKVYRVSGPLPAAQPLSAIASFTAETDVRPVISLGGGVKFNLGGGATLRAEFRDYFTPFPSSLIQPAPYATGRGFLHQFTPMLGLGYSF